VNGSFSAFGAFELDNSVNESLSERMFLAGSKLESGIRPLRKR
jgi:hypothetical protein